METKILVVDDDLVTRKGLTELLKEVGYDALAVESGEKAMEMARVDDFTLALVDLKMPGMNGIEVLKALKSIKPKLYLVMITAYATIETAVEAMKLGAFDYIRKPFKADELIAVVESIVGEERLERSLRDFEFKRTEKNVMDFFVDELKDRKGLLITKEDPKTLKQNPGLSNVPIYRLTEDGGSKESIKPNEMNKIKKLVTSFLRKNKGCVICINGVEMLVKNNPWTEVERFLGNLTESANTGDAILIVSASPETLDEHSQMDLEKALRGDYTQNMSESLANPMRRAVLRYLALTGKASFMDILRNIKEKDSPKLSFHIKKLSSFDVIEKDANGIYMITKRGEKLLSILDSIDGEGRRESNTFLIYNAHVR
jgi:DNA-binding response OmpR family regulator/DNA-binding transcriptional ArsR family regulator